ncbi:hypothetical protein TNCV_252371 [Trichonephila clavipes]|nr:hypothetical protein TNCV_252371 [Trichonephila clavipes]
MRADMTVKVFGESSDSFVQRLNVCVFVEVFSRNIARVIKNDSEGSVLQDLKFVNVGFGRTTPDLACVGQYWLEVLQVDLSFAIAGRPSMMLQTSSREGDEGDVVSEHFELATLVDVQVDTIGELGDSFFDFI